MEAACPRAGSRDSVLALAGDVKGDLERAVRFLQIIQTMRETLIPQLQKTYDDLYRKGTVATETEVIVSALIEELEDVNDAVENAVENAKRVPDSEISSSAAGVDDPESLLEAEVVELLKGLQSEFIVEHRCVCSFPDGGGGKG